MKKIFLTPIILLILTLSNNVIASDQKREQIKQLLELTQMEAMVYTMHQQILATLRSQAESITNPSSEREILDRHLNKVLSILETEVTWEKVEPKFVDVYEKIFTENEILEITNFYKTETGQALIKKMPIIMQDSMAMSQELLKEITPALNKETASFIDELKKSRNLP